VVAGPLPVLIRSRMMIRMVLVACAKPKDGRGVNGKKAQKPVGVGRVNGKKRLFNPARYRDGHERAAPRDACPTGSVGSAEEYNRATVRALEDGGGMKELRFCTRCSASAAPGDVFCRKCGASLSQVDVSPASPLAIAPVAVTKGSGSERSTATWAKLLAAIVVVVVLVGLGSYGYYQFAHGNAQSSATPTTHALAGSVAPTLTTKPGFSPTGSMTDPRSGHTATLLSDGRVLIAGGWDGLAALASAELYDPKTGAFTPTGSMTTGRMNHTATLLKDGRVLITGGGTGRLSINASAELYDPKTGAFTPTGSMTTGRESATATLLSDGSVLITGGLSSAGVGVFEALRSAERYDPRTGTFGITSFMTVARVSHTATVLSDGRVLIAGGTGLASAELYDPKTGAFTPTGSMTDPRSGHTATLLSDGRVLIVGGGLDSAELFDPAAGTFSVSASTIPPCKGNTATLLSDGRVLIAGGSSFTLANLYDPTTDGFITAGSMTTGRESATATLLSDGSVLITGGADGSASLASAELYQP